ncbi:MAG: penicillin-binding protein 1C [Lewinellaceae bacterium]|nr:penicillin-binding protein 1C [Saprospiraceae bacterium]MCB9333967.1 penicillin-binding protein 1C [Lewinellaceae bacterium]
MPIWNLPTVFQQVQTAAAKYAWAAWHRLRFWVARYPKTSLATVALLVIWIFCLPRPLFDKPVSIVLEDQHGELLGARIAGDGQWRFPAQTQVPDNYAQCVVAFEDKRFWWHPGVDPISIARALWLNLKKRKVASGGSTLTMQVIRMARDNPPRTVWEKIVEVFMATRLELRCSKTEILALYAANAPFGGNVVGLEAASWRYFGKKPALLSWAEAATLAVLPNSPALIHPGRNRTALLHKRNQLLDHLAGLGTISASTCALAKEEPLPEAPLPLPQLAPHLLDRLAANRKLPSESRFATAIDRELQQRVTNILQRRQERYRGNGVYNLAALVLDVSTGKPICYVGNVMGAGAEHGEQVDVIAAPRSTGSILKPFLYALALENGTILPNSLLHDVPTQLGQYRPENYYETYDGAVPARRALVRSLNIPFVLLLQEYGLEKFHFELQKLGLTTLHHPPAHYGLTLILGGAEACLLDITSIYARMAKKLNQATQYPPEKEATDPLKQLSPSAIWFTFEAMQQVERPTSLGEWELFETSRRIAWKTGTSFGFRDAWAAGVTPQYAVGVWVGNADGEGRPGLLGVEMAAPVLFEIFEQLPNDGSWFEPPYDNMKQVPVCRQSGFRAGPNCEADTSWIPKTGLKAGLCTYHQLLHLDSSAQWQVSSACEPPFRIIHRPWFVLSPLEEFYYMRKNPTYQPPPPFRPDCVAEQTAPDQLPMQLIYPNNPTRIYVPVDLDGKRSSTVFQVAHRIPETEIFWHLDGVFLGSTKTFHQMALQPAVGKHRLTLVDIHGNRVEQNFEIIGKGG